MNADALFLHEISCRPNDPAPRIAYAQWLDRRGDARGELIRLHLLMAECFNDEEFFLLLNREQSVRRRIADEWLAAFGCGDAYARFLHLHEGLWLTDSGTILRWGTPLEKLVGREGGRLEQIQPLGVRVVWHDRVIWRGMRATIHAEFLPNDEGELPAGVQHFTIVKPRNWHSPITAGAVRTTLRRAALAIYPRRRLAALTAHGQEWLDGLRYRFGSPTDGGSYRKQFRTVRWEWSCARLEMLMSERDAFLCQWLEHPAARRLPALRKIDEAVELSAR